MELVPHHGAAGAVALAQVNSSRYRGKSGTSDSWASYQHNVAGIFVQFAVSDSEEVGFLMGATHSLISEEHATKREVWERFHHLPLRRV